MFHYPLEMKTASHMPPTDKNFETARRRKFRADSLGKEDERTISHIEEFGCSVVSVAATNGGLGWSYTIGVFDTTGKPEIISVGLSPGTAHFALNEAAKLQRTGVDLTLGRHRDLIGEVECEFSSHRRKMGITPDELGSLVLRGPRFPRAAGSVS